MSKENVQKFYEALAQDAELAKELKARTAAATFAFATEKGFEFTAEDLTEDSAELSEEDLDQVNGGVWEWFCDFGNPRKKLSPPPGHL